MERLVKQLQLFKASRGLTASEAEILAEILIRTEIDKYSEVFRFMLALYRICYRIDPQGKDQKLLEDLMLSLNQCD